MDDKFAPLSGDEIEQGETIATTEGDDAGELVSPVPADAPPPPSIHYRHGNAVAVWKYRNEQGALLFEVHRFEPAGEKKQILPLSLWRDGVGYRWRWKGFPAPRPLYNLDKFAANPAAPVVITEGEKDADAAALIFLNSIATTSPNGSQAASKADWTPLAGRKVLIWGDADAPGLKYAREVAEILAALGCAVSIVDAVAFASMAPDGSKRDPVEGWGAADAVDECADLAALRKAAVRLAKPFEAGPSYVSWDAFMMDAGGLTMEVTKGRGGKSETVDEWVCSAFEVLGATRDPHGRDWGKWLRWRDGDGREHLRHVSESALQGDPASLAASLAGDGLRVNRAQQRALASYLCGVSTKGRVTVVSRTGWHSIGGRDVFVLPGQVLGRRGSENVILDAVAVGPYDARGTLEEWRAGVGTLGAEHALAVLAISTALAGTLLHLAGSDGGGLHFVGNAALGKSSLQYAAASVWGRGPSPGYIRSWRATANGLEGAAASASDTVLVLDEMGLIEPRELSAAVYSLANGSGKSRAARDGSLREPKSWRVMVLSSGELTISAKIGEERGKRAKAGQLSRILDIPADRGLGFGAFDSGGPESDPGELAKAIRRASSSAYGTAGPEFVRRLIADGVEGEAVRAMVADFTAAEIPAGADGQIGRAAERLGLIATAGELATVLGVTPWVKGAAWAAAAWALRQWIDGRGGTEPAEVRQAIEAVRLVIELHAESRFEPLDGGEGWRPMGSRLGWRTGEGAERQWLIPSEVWKSEVCAGLDHKFAAKVLGERGMLERAGDGWQPVRKIAGTNKRVYVVRATIFEGAGHGD